MAADRINPVNLKIQIQMGSGMVSIVRIRIFMM